MPKRNQYRRPSDTRRKELHQRLVVVQRELSGGPSFERAMELQAEYERANKELDEYYQEEPPKDFYPDEQPFEELD